MTVPVAESFRKTESRFVDIHEALFQQDRPTTHNGPAERLQNARRKKLIVGYKSWILPAMNGCSPNQQPRKGTAHEALLRPRRLLHGPAHRGSRSRTHLRSRAG